MAGASRIGLLLHTALSFSFLRLSLQRCRPEYRSIQNHTACLPPNHKCSILSSGLTSAEQKLFLNIHNKFRSVVARGRLPGFPPSSNMRKLRWDSGLAEVAEAHAKQCIFRHDSGRLRVTIKFLRTGQNMAAFWESNNSSPGRNEIEKAVRSWFDEYKDYSPSSVLSFTQNAVGPVGHFTQVIWANTQYMGCGAVLYSKGGQQGGTTKFFVCNYADTGNIAGKPVYLPGRMCSHCPRGAACELPAGLCVGGYSKRHWVMRSRTGRPYASVTPTRSRVTTWKAGYTGRYAAPWWPSDMWNRRSSFNILKEWRHFQREPFTYAQEGFTLGVPRNVFIRRPPRLSVVLFPRYGR
ncbi:scoloptoxin SSD552-like [Amblyomma americanum]